MARTKLHFSDSSWILPPQIQSHCPLPSPALLQPRRPGSHPPKHRGGGGGEPQRHPTVPQNSPSYLQVSRPPPPATCHSPSGANQETADQGSRPLSGGAGKRSYWTAYTRHRIGLVAWFGIGRHLPLFLSVGVSDPESQEADIPSPKAHVMSGVRSGSSVRSGVTTRPRVGMRNI